MKILKKEEDRVELIAFPDEHFEKGDYLAVEDEGTARALVLQVIDVRFASIPGILEDILRDGMTNRALNGGDEDPLDINSQVTLLKDTKLAICKVRGAINNGHFVRSAAWLPSRTRSKIYPLPIQRFIQDERVRRPVMIGSTRLSGDLVVDAKGLDGKLSIVTGRKGTGKSHLTKLIILGLVDNGAPCLVLDVNGEYVKLGQNRNGTSNPYRSKIAVLSPGRNLRFSLNDIGLHPFTNMLLYALDLPTTSTRVFQKLWHDMEARGTLSLRSMADAILRADCHETVRDAILSRYNTIIESGLFTDCEAEAIGLGRILAKISTGGALVANMKNQSAIFRRMLVELLISKLATLLSASALRAIFLFAEEAHLYLRETYWEDIVTRMRHLGVFTTFITNQPDTVQENIYRQADNLFIFNFSNEHDLDAVSKAAKVDGETVRLLVKDLPAHHCLAIGDVVRDFPVVVEVRGLDVDTLGGTRFFFDD